MQSLWHAVTQDVQLNTCCESCGVSTACRALMVCVCCLTVHSKWHSFKQMHTKHTFKRWNYFVFLASSKPQEPNPVVQHFQLATANSLLVPCPLSYSFSNYLLAKRKKTRQVMRLVTQLSLCLTIQRLLVWQPTPIVLSYRKKSKSGAQIQTVAVLSQKPKLAQMAEFL